MCLHVVAGGIGSGVIERLIYLRSEPSIVSRFKRWGLGRGDEHRYGREIALNDDLRTRAHMSEYSGKVADRLSLRDVDDRHNQMIPLPRHG